MILPVKQFVSKLIILIVSLFGLHFLLFRAFEPKILEEFILLVEIYGFLLVLTLGHILALKWLFKKWSKYSGFIFTGLSLLKMMVSILYLMPYIFPSKEQSIAIALNFMVVYFVLLVYEVIFIARSMGKNH